MRVHLIATLTVVAATASAQESQPADEPVELEAEAEPEAAASGVADSSQLAEIFFEFDSARVEGATEQLDAVVAWAEANPDAKIVLDGHADPRGTGPYNVGLAARRSESVEARLVARGVDPDRILTVTYGEDDEPRDSFAEDRRVTVWATQAPLYAIVEHSLGRGTAVVWNEPVSATALLAPRTNQVSIRD